MASKYDFQLFQLISAVFQLISAVFQLISAIEL